MTDTHVDFQIISFIYFVWVLPGKQQLEDTHVDAKTQTVILPYLFYESFIRKLKDYLCLHPKEEREICAPRDAKQLILVSNKKRPKKGYTSGWGGGGGMDAEEAQVWI